MYDFMNPPIDDVEGNDLQAATIELDSIDGSAVLADGFIVNSYPSTVNLNRERVIVLERSDLTFKQCTMRAMIGLYVLKEKYSSAEVNVYGKRYTFELRKFAVPNKSDFVTVHRVISKAIGDICNNNPVVWDELNAILIQIQQDEWKFVE